MSLGRQVFRGLTQNNKLKGLKRADIEKIEAIQPYQTGDPDPVTGLRQADPTDPHYVLEELAILDRHRRLALLPCYPISFNPKVRITKGVGNVKSITPDDSKLAKPLKHGDVVATFRMITTTQCEYEVSPGALVHIFPSDVMPVDGSTFDVWVRKLQKAVFDVVKAFEGEF